MATKEGETHLSIIEQAGVGFLLSNEGEVPLSCIEGKTTCLFFSANWCRPCRNFTPRLIQLYTALKNTEKDVQIVFVSLDRDENSFLDHFKHMPWLAVPFNVDIRRRLRATFKIDRIPSLTPFAPNGMLIEEDAVKLVEDYGIDAFPFDAKRREQLRAIDEAKRQGGKIEELLGCKERDYAISKDGKKVPIVELAGKTTGLYFGAQWCPPCRAFTTTLVEAYNELRISKSGGFEIVLISMDRDEEEFKSSLEKVPWISIPYHDKTRHDLCRIFNIKGIPALVILGPDGKTLRTDGRAIISNFGATAFPFTEAKVAEAEEALKKEGEKLPHQVKDPRHEHVLKLDIARCYVCDSCKKQGRYWVFSCARCDFDLHPSCIEENQKQ
ncbi:putative nucleoredoxin 3 [Ananas comosus]|uniref:protein-disulfide reductase n=1 Tax=Ananas comosus TaxID=4615 RepID=A0A199UQ26_ANACO|nr:putative nucleoredoxin 3 [Ananas comosus]